jgi:hypothetical protein
VELVRPISRDRSSALSVDDGVRLLGHVTYCLQTESLKQRCQAFVDQPVGVSTISIAARDEPVGVDSYRLMCADSTARRKMPTVTTTAASRCWRRARTCWWRDSLFHVARTTFDALTFHMKGGNLNLDYGNAT